MIHHMVSQNSEEWDALRLGKFTASMFGDLFMDKKTKTYQDAIIKVAYETVTGESEESYSNKWMQRGHEKEPFARQNYEIYTGEELEDCGFFEYSQFVGASPDAKILNKNAGCEFKCPSFQVYNEYLESGKLPKRYYWQVHGQLLCTGWDYIDFYPFSHHGLKQILVRVERDEIALNQLIERLNESVEEVQKLIKTIRQ